MENKTIPIFPCFFFPNIEYFQYLNGFDNVLIETCETFPKQTFRNRTYIFSANGVLSLNIPIIKNTNLKEKTSEVRICYKDNWNIKSYRAITSSYGRSPYFEFFEEDIKYFFLKKYDKLLDLNMDILLYFNNIFKINANIRMTNFYVNSESIEKKELDFRNYFHTKELLNKNSDSQFVKYIQCFEQKHGFIANLSCLDLLFNIGLDSISYIKNTSKSII